MTRRIGCAWLLLPCAAVLHFAGSAAVAGDASDRAAVAEPLLAAAPPSIAVESSRRVATAAGGPAVTESVLRVHGRRLRMTVTGDATGDAPPTDRDGSPFSHRVGRRVVEFRAADAEPLPPEAARVAAWELGFAPKPESIDYRVGLRLVLVDEAEPDACRPLSRALQALADGDESAAEEVDRLAWSVECGNTLRLRGRAFENAEHFPSPHPLGAVNVGPGSREATKYRFAETPEVRGLPVVDLSVELTVDDAGFREAPAASPAALATTETFPAGDPGVIRRAGSIAGSAESDAAKVAAILASLQDRDDPAAVAVEFVTLARAAGVPARLVAGVLYGAGEHVWAEWHRAAAGDRPAGWQQVDPSLPGGAAGLYHIPIFTSEAGEPPAVHAARPRPEIIDTGTRLSMPARHAARPRGVRIR